MKKINLFVMSIFALLCGVLLSACTFKKPQVEFKQDEVVVSVGQEIKLDDYFTAKDVDKSEIKMKISDTAIFELDGNVAKAKSSGKAVVYATYQNNSLASMNLVVKRAFEAPEDFMVDENGNLNWRASFAYLANEATPTVAQKYLVEGVCNIYSLDQPNIIIKTETINTQVNTNSYKLPFQGEYSITVKALASGYFEDSAESSAYNFKFGYMPQAINLSWNATTATLSWQRTSDDAMYRVCFDDAILDDMQEYTTKDLKTYFDKAKVGTHTLSVMSFDATRQKMTSESEKIVVTKLSKPQFEFENGKIKLASTDGADKVDLIFSQSSNTITKTYTLGADGTLLTDVSELDSKIYDLKVVAKNESGNFYRSDDQSVGKIYKLPKLSLEGVGLNAENGNKLALKISTSESLVETSFKIFGLTNEVSSNGFQKDQTTLNVSINIPSAGKYTLTAKQISTESSINGEKVYVLDSDESEVLNVEKLKNFSNQVSHSTVDNKSVLKFDLVENATKYELFIKTNPGNEEAYSLVEASKFTLDKTSGKITFVDKIENLFEPLIGENENYFEFKIVAKTDDEKTEIASAITKKIVYLSKPSSNGSGNSTNHTYTWLPVNGADQYRLEIYELTKQEYDDNKDEITLTKDGATPILTNKELHNFENVGYYYVKIYSVSTDENIAISSKDCLEEVFFIADKLQTPVAVFGFDEEKYKNDENLTNASGYFVQIDQAENVDKFEIQIDGGNGETKILPKVEGSDKIIVLLTETFESGLIDVKIVAKSNDSTIYNDSDEKILTVRRLDPVKYGTNEGNLQVDILTSTASIKKMDGVTQISITDSTNGDLVNVQTDAVMPIKGKTNFELKVKLYGNEILSDKTYAGNKIYLDSQESVIKFSRLATPTELRYYNGELNFDHTDANTAYYILDLVCVTANGENQNISVLLDPSSVSAIYNNTTIPLMGLSQSALISSSGSAHSIKISTLVAFMKNFSAIKDVYDQSTKIGFSVSAYQRKESAIAGTVLISSLDATTKTDPTQTVLYVEKMTKPNLSFEATTTTLKWEKVATSTDVESETKYEIYDTNGKINEVSGALQAGLELTIVESTYYQYYIKATNPYYLESNNSNYVRFYKLKAPLKLSTTNEESLVIESTTAEKDFVSSIELSIGAEDPILITDNKITDLKNGAYKLRSIGKIVEEDNQKTYYLNSNYATWTLQTMDALKPSDESLIYNNNVLSWNKYAEEKGFDNLSYMVVFKSGETYATYQTDVTSVDLLADSELYKKIETLAEGQITVKVYAFLKNYSTLAGQTLYYNLAKTLLNGSQEVNYYEYQNNTTLKKLTTPTVDKVEFVSADIRDSMTPTIKVSFSGNYEVGDEYNVYLNDDVNPIFDSNKVLTADDFVDGKISFEISDVYYNNSFVKDGKMMINIVVTSPTAMPSNKGQVEISRAKDIQKLSFVKNGDFITQILRIEFEETSKDALGGVVLKVEMNVGSVVKTSYRIVTVTGEGSSFDYDLGDLFRNELTSGGLVQVSAFINNYSQDDDKVYYLASPTLTDSISYSVLKAVDDSCLNIVSGGIQIDEATNTRNTTYVVVCGTERYEVKYVDGKFYFEIPNTWTDKDYQLLITAIEESSINSVETKITYTLKRVERIDDIVATRDTSRLEKVKLSWKAKDNASGYLLKMFDGDKCLYEKEISTNEVYVDELFVDNYRGLTSQGIDVNNLISNENINFKIITIGSGLYNNSYSYDFTANFARNPMLASSKALKDVIKVDEYGFAQFESEAGKNYLYRIVSNSGDELQKWTMVTATSEWTRIDASKIDSATLTDATAYNVEIKVVGVGESTNEYKFLFDSMKLTTLSKAEMTLYVNDKIIDVGYKQELGANVAFTMAVDSFTKLYVGLEANAIEDPNKVFAFVPYKTELAGTAGQEIYSYPINDLIEMFRKSNLEWSAGEITMYFWSIRDSEETSLYTTSRSATFNFTLQADAGFEKIMKMGKNDGTNKNYDSLSYAIGYEDYSNTFALFKKTSGLFNITAGFLVKVTDVSNGREVIEFLSASDLNHDYFKNNNYYVINLTTLFEKPSLKNSVGEFNVEFARLSLVNFKMTISDWTSLGEGKTIKRLSAINNLLLNSGNLVWNLPDNSEGVEKYYVYFETMTGDEITGLTYFATSRLFFDASSFVGENDSYKVSVQSICEDEYVLPSLKDYVMSGDNKADVYKNKITSPLLLKNGTLYVKWNTESGSANDFYKTISSLTTENINSNTADEINKTIFQGPFSFTLKDLIMDKIKFRFKFTSLDSVEGTSQFVDVSARDLLGEIGEEVKANLTQLYNVALNDDGCKDNFEIFIKNIANDGSFGIANYNTLFDHYFENIQTGCYRLEYCLLGGENTLNSKWYEFKNNNVENKFYVNVEPTIKVIKETNEYDLSLSSYKLLIKESQITNYDESTKEYTKAKATNYVMRLYASKKYVFNITRSEYGFVLNIAGSTSENISVSRTNELGENDESGEYLAFYLNLNNGNSLLGKYSETIEKAGIYSLEIYAEGSDYSASSKSSYYRLTFLSFDQKLSITNGVFNWVAQQNRTTSIIYKNVNSEKEEEAKIDGGKGFASFDMASLGDGNYVYVKFVMKGEVISNNIYVDSEVYIIENVHKLASPTLSDALGEITITDNNQAVLGNCFVEENEAMFKYEISNDVSQGKYYQFTNTNGTNETSYQVGTTQIDENNPIFDYKQTEIDAKEFYVSSLGTTSAFRPERYDSVDANYYMYRLLCFDKNDKVSDKHVAVRSNRATLKAIMLGAVENLRIEDSILVWNAQSKRELGSDIFEVDEGESTVVYKVSVGQYKTSFNQDGENQADIADMQYYYTAKNSFDFALIEENLQAGEDEKIFIRATVQAMALKLSDSEVEKAVSLVEGGFAYQNAMFKNSEHFVLKSEGVTLPDIERLAPVDEDSITTENGSLIWTYTTQKTFVFNQEIVELTEANFFDYYNFVVSDADKNIVSGVCSPMILTSDNKFITFKITFLEDKGSMPVGDNVKLNVYTTQGTKNKNLSIKSFSRSAVVKKLRTISENDFTIDAVDDYEILDLSNYFDDAETDAGNRIFVTIQINNDETGKKEFVLTKSDCKIAVYSYDVENPTTKFYFVVKDDDVASLLFKIKPITDDIKGTLYSDFSDPIVLQRSTLENSEVLWDENTQIFSWQYNGNYAFEKQTKSKTVRVGDVLTKRSDLFTDETLTTKSGLSFNANAEIQVVARDSAWTKIIYNSEYYYVITANVTKAYIDMDEVDLPAGTLYVVVETLDGDTIIKIGEELYRVQTSDIDFPVYVVEAIYGKEVNNKIVRTYITKDNYFAPTIVGDVTISVRIKLGERNLQSKKLKFTNGTLFTNEENEDLYYVKFSLFDSGDGTSANPYVIKTNDQFLNISQRMKKEDYLKSYISNSKRVDESEVFNFSIENDITLFSKDSNGVVQNGYEFEGILFKGEFDGVIVGNSHTITYKSTGVSTLSSPITVTVGNVLSSSTENQTQYKVGAGLFEKFSRSTSVSDLLINATFEESENNVSQGDNAYVKQISRDALVSGLVVSNSGTIDNISVTGFDSKFYGFINDGVRLIMAYSGIASINQANITNCKATSNIEISDYGRPSQFIFVGGICFTNYATITSCTSGIEGEERHIEIDCKTGNETIQVAGVVVTNSSTSTLSRCTNYYSIKVSAITGIKVTVFLAGVVDLGEGVIQFCTNNGTLQTNNIDKLYRTTDGIWATTKRPN